MSIKVKSIHPNVDVGLQGRITMNCFNMSHRVIDTALATLRLYFKMSLSIGRRLASCQQRKAI